jgi:hypothetical protein
VYCVWQVVKTPIIISNNPVHFCGLILKLKSVLPFLCSVSILYSSFQCLRATTFEYSNFEKLILKYLKIFTFHLSDVQTDCEVLFPLILPATLYESSTFAFFAFLLLKESHSPQSMIMSSSQRTVPTIVKSVAAHYQIDDLLNCWTSSSDIYGYHSDFHQGHGTVGVWQGQGMGTAWARHVWISLKTARGMALITLSHLVLRLKKE